MKIRRKVDPEKWPLPGLNVPNHTRTDFSQLIDCPEFVPRQMTEEPSGEHSDLLLIKLKYGETNYDIPVVFCLHSCNKFCSIAS